MYAIRSYYVLATAKTRSGQPIISASSAVVEIKNSNRKTVVKANLTNTGSGIYTYQYRLPANAPIGTWSAKVSFVNGRDKGNASQSFIVTESLPPDPITIDNDGDGFSVNQGDCNDTSSAIYPGATEICGRNNFV